MEEGTYSDGIFECARAASPRINTFCHNMDTSNFFLPRTFRLSILYTWRCPFLGDISLYAVSAFLATIIALSTLLKALESYLHKPCSAPRTRVLIIQAAICWWPFSVLLGHVTVEMFFTRKSAWTGFAQVLRTLKDSLNDEYRKEGSQPHEALCVVSCE